MAQAKFKVGSGGPDMTVADLETGARERIKCQWFGGRKLEQGFFDIDSLVLTSEVEKKAKE
jgi:uncharacterized protein YodC (DUF2158 family)